MTTPERALDSSTGRFVSRALLFLLIFRLIFELLVRDTCSEVSLLRSRNEARLAAAAATGGSRCSCRGSLDARADFTTRRGH